MEGVNRMEGSNTQQYVMESNPMSSDYNSNCRPQNAATADLIASIQQFVVPSLLSQEFGNSIRVMDNGCATGSNSVYILSRLMKNVVDEMDVKANLTVFLNDIRENDWSVLKATVQSGMSSQIAKNMFSFRAVPKSMYGDVLSEQEETLHLVYSSTALHWLSATPTVALSDPHIIWGQYDPEETVKRGWVDQAAADWDIYLQARGKETVEGGFLAVTVVTATPGFEKVINATKKQLVIDGTISGDVALRLILPVYGRNQEEILAGFTRGDNGSLVWKDIWKIVNIRDSEFSCPETTEFKKNLKTNEERISGVIGFCKACMEPSFLVAFSDLKSAELVMKQFWAVATQLALELPVEEFQTKYSYAVVVMKREGSEA